MIIDFEKIEETTINGFKGGEGLLHMQAFVDENRVRVMKSCLEPGARSGAHLHDMNCELMYVLKGALTCYCGGRTEVALAGQVHYCPMGEQHAYANLGTEPVEYLAIVPEQKVNG